MERLLPRLIRLTNQYNKLVRRVRSLETQLEETKTKPYSKVKKQPKFGNQDLVFDGNTKIWHTYAVFKDDEEE